MSVFDSLRLRLSQSSARLRTRAESSRLKAKSDESSTRLGKALDRALSNDFTAEEIAWMNRIEGLRARLNVSRDSVTVHDFGAVDPKLTLTDDEMLRGRVVPRIVGEISLSASKPVFWCHVLFSLIREFKPARCVELGCCLGISASYQAAALTLNGKGQFYTLEGSPALVELSRKHFAEMGLKNITAVPGRFLDTLTDVLNQTKPVEYAFIDGHHDHDATLQYFEQIYAAAAPEACIVFDDVNWSAGMKKAWRAVREDSRVAEVADLGTIGVALVNRK